MDRLVTYVRKNDIAHSLNISRTCLDRWIAEEKLTLPPAFKPTKRCALYDLNEVKEAIEAMVARS